MADQMTKSMNEYDHSPHNDQESNEQPKPKRSRNRKPVTCSQCRKRKLKCDRNDPCGACEGRGEAHLCSWEDAIKLSQTKNEPSSTREQDAVLLRHQLDRLESILASHESNSPKEGSSHEIIAHISENSPYMSALPSSYLQSSTSQNLPPVLVHQSFGNMNSNEHMGIENDQHYLNKCVHFERVFLELLPIIHHSTFQMLCANIKSHDDDDDDDTNNDSVYFLKKAIIAFDAFLQPITDASELQYAANKLRELSQLSLSMLLSERSPSLTTVQALIILHELQTYQNPELAPKTFAIAVQVAKDIGIDIYSNEKNRYKIMANETQEDEMRYTWEYLYSRDGLNARYSYLCNPKHTDPLIFKPRDKNVTILSSSTLLAYRVEISDWNRKITDVVFSSSSIPTYSTIIDVHNDLLDLIMKLPRVFPEGCPGMEFSLRTENHVMAAEMFVFNCQLFQMIIRIHQPFFLPGMFDSSLMPSRVNCLSLAYIIVSLHKQRIQTTSTLQTLALHLHLCNASLIIALNAFFTIPTESRGAQLQEILAILQESNSSLFHPAIQETIRVITILSSWENTTMIKSSYPIAQMSSLKKIPETFGGFDISPVQLGMSQQTYVEKMDYERGRGHPLYKIFDGLATYGDKFYTLPSRKYWNSLFEQRML